MHAPKSIKDLNRKGICVQFKIIFSPSFLVIDYSSAALFWASNPTILGHFNKARLQDGLVSTILVIFSFH